MVALQINPCPNVGSDPGPLVKPPAVWTPLKGTENLGATTTFSLGQSATKVAATGEYAQQAGAGNAGASYSDANGIPLASGLQVKQVTALPVTDAAPVWSSLKGTENLGATSPAEIGADATQTGATGQYSQRVGTGNATPTYADANGLPLQPRSAQYLPAVGKVAPQVDPKVTAEGTVGGIVYRDVNQTAKLGSSNEPTLIADRVAKKKADAERKNLKLKVYPNGTIADSHAEIGVIQQAHTAGKTQGQDMVMKVTGKDVCGFCIGDIAAAAKAAGLKSLTVHAIDNHTGLPKTYYWEPGMKAIKELQ